MINKEKKDIYVLFFFSIFLSIFIYFTQRTTVKTQMGNLIFNFLLITPFSLPLFKIIDIRRVD